MNIIILDPFYDYSHKQWAEGFKKYSSHHIEILSLSPHHWKWRMVGGAIDLATKYKQLNIEVDLILATDMLDLNSFLSLVEIDKVQTKIALYFHENQITYPWQNENTPSAQERNHHYGFVNFRSCLCADKIFFNSHFHMNSFIESLPSFLKIFPGFKYKEYVEKIAEKSSVLPLGLEFPQSPKLIPESDAAVFLWNHRWEFDKNPVCFFNTLIALKQEGIQFQLIVLGKAYASSPPIFDKAKNLLQEEIIHWGFVQDKAEYNKLLKQSNILLVTSQQDFFGISAVEAIAQGVYPILPNRLAFPEHIPEHIKQEVFFEKEEELIPKLKALVNNKKYLETELLQEYVQKYNWSLLIDKYDSTFQAMQGSIKVSI